MGRNRIKNATLDYIQFNLIWNLIIHPRSEQQNTLIMNTQFGSNYRGLIFNLASTLLSPSL
jgi:hypothetical protein